MFITREHIEEIDKLTKQGLTVKQAANQLDISFNGAMYAASKYGIELKRMTLADRVMVRADEISSSEHTNKWWADELCTTPQALGLAFKKLGVKTLRRQQQSKTSDIRKADYRRVLGHIAATRRHIPHVLKALGLKPHAPPIPDFAPSIGINLQP